VVYNDAPQPKTGGVALGDNGQVGRYMIGVGILLVLAGLIFLGAEKLGIHPGRLPGDIRIEGKRGGFYFPIVTCLIVSALLTLISWFFRSR